MKYPKTATKVGILGGGQLARMLVTAGQEMGLEMHVLCPNIREPAAQVCMHTHLGQIDSEANLFAFFKDVDVVTVESEFLNVGTIKKALATFKERLPFQPDADLLETIQDRLTQKQLLKNFNIPTAPFVAWNSDESIERLQQHFKGRGFVIKKRRGGYDGYGTFVFKKKSQLKQKLQQEPFGYIAEAFVPFRRELAFSVARNSQNEFAVFPLVETFQINSRCLWVKGPTKHLKLTSLVSKVKKMMNETNYCGILAVELFEWRGSLFVNELAPRVHNSAHYSMDALDLSQFEAHLRGVLAMPLKKPLPIGEGFAMVNLLGDENSKHEVFFSREPLGRLHWYGKTELRAGRKMGHINTFGTSPDKALHLALKWRKGFRL